MDPSIQHRLQEIIAQRTGLHLRETELVDLDRYVARRMATLKLHQPAAFLDRLAGDTSEWAALTAIITTGESYFLRDQGQMTLLRTHILPDLLERRSQERALSIWSAGCSTGEEIYSLAILLDQVVSNQSLDLSGWRIILLGTDLNEVACRHAEVGEYGDWSFRGVPAAVQTHYFTRPGQNWRVNDALRRNVCFRGLNLLQDAYPPPESVDLILCRNVLIYLTPSAIAQVMDGFGRTLRGGGYLLTGHGELQGFPLGNLTRQLLPGSVVYRPQVTRAISVTLPSLSTSARIRPLAPAARSSSSAAPPLASPSTSFNRHRPLGEDVPTSHQSPIQAWLATAQSALDRGDSAQADDLAQRILAQAPDSLPACLILAQANANTGRLQQAQVFCQQAIRLNALAPLPHYLLAHIAQEQADPRTARRHYQKALYLDPVFIPALLELSALLDQPNEASRSKELRRSAQEHLLTLPPDQPIAPYAETAAQLLAHWTQNERQVGP